MEEQNQTLYINNLNDRVNKDETKRLLYHLFCTYGYILEIQTAKFGKLRGQAFVVFDKEEAAGIAMRDLQGFNFLGKPLRIAFARAQSHAIQKVQGTFIYPKKSRK
jgi:U2 small nuclear ribonucleoprotein B''